MVGGMETTIIPRLASALIGDVLGGGIPLGTSYLFDGAPGAGKSTCMAQVCAELAGAGTASLYVCGEEEPPQVTARFQRICGRLPDLVHLTKRRQVSEIRQEIQATQARFVVVDSLQAVTARPTPAQLQRTADQLHKVAGELGVALVLVCHVTKNGQYAGPRSLEHLVGARISFEIQGFGRMLSVGKNRYGMSFERAMFEMTDKGLRRAKDPSELLAASSDRAVPGQAWGVGIVDGRAELFEVDVLVQDTSKRRRAFIGVDRARGMGLIQYLEGLHPDLQDREVLVRISGTRPPKDPAFDAPILWALWSALDKLLVRRRVVIGEFSYADGLLRPVAEMEQRLLLACRCGLAPAMVPLQYDSPCDQVVIPNILTLKEKLDHWSNIDTYHVHPIRKLAAVQ